MEQKGIEEELLQCIMCTNQVPEEFLRRHIKFHHMIQKEDAIRKVYLMHMSADVISTNTQTNVTWIDTLQNIQETIEKIENSTEIRRAMPTESTKETPLLQNASDRHKILGIAHTKTIDHSSLEKETSIDQSLLLKSKSIESKTHKIANQMNNLISEGTLTVTKVKHDEDEPVIIAEKKTEKTVPETLCSNMKNNLRKNWLSQDAVSEETEFDHSILIENSQTDEAIHVRYKCPYCEFFDIKNYIVNDHLIIQHNEEAKEKRKSSPMYGEAKKQKMRVGIFADSTTKRHVRQYLSNLEIDEKQQKDKINEKYDCLECEWEKSDATLPYGWLMKDNFCEYGRKDKIFLSPCKKPFSSRNEVSDFLRKQGQKILKLEGFKVADTSKSKCNGMCEGKCKLFIVPKSFYHSKDKNKIRQKTKLKFIAENDIPIRNKVKDKLVKKVPKLKPVKGLIYGKPVEKGTRPWIIFIEENPPPCEDENRNDLNNTDGGKSLINLKGMKLQRPVPDITTNLTVEKASVNENYLDKNIIQKVGEFSNQTSLKGIKVVKGDLKIRSTDIERCKTYQDKIKEKKMIEICTLNEDIFPIESLSPTVAIRSARKESGQENLNNILANHEVKHNEMGEFYNTFSEIEVIHNDFEIETPAKRKIDQISKSKGPARKKIKSSDPKAIEKLLNRDSSVNKMINKPLPRVETIKEHINQNSRLSQKDDSDSENELNKKRNIQKLKRLQRKEIEVNKSEGTYVQCCDTQCLKWRLVKEFEDPTMVPDYWICSMNSDPQNNKCGEGGHSFMSDYEAVDVKFTCGSMVWAKMHSYPWWPGMVDYCPDSEEYYWIEESQSLTEPAWYHVVFFEGKGKQVSRAWIKSELIMKITLPIDPPKSIVKSKEIKMKLGNAIQMATHANMMTREERLEKYSFAALFNGKWGIYSDLESDTEELKGNEDGDHQSSSRILTEKLSKKKAVIMKKPSNRLAVEEKKRMEAKLGQKYRPIVSNCTPIFQNAKGSRKPLNITNDKSMSTPEVELNPRYKNETTPTSKKNMLIRKHKKSDSFLFSVDHCYSKISSEQTSPKKSNILENLKYVNKALEDAQRKHPKVDANLHLEHPNLIKHHPKPPLPSDVLIALSVRNLDPSNHFGASFNNIIAFLSLHFPYFNRNVEECKQMVRKAYDMNTRDETGKENFRIKGTLIQQLSVRIDNHVERNQSLVKKSMLIPDLLDLFMDRFLNGNDSNPVIHYKPQLSWKIISYLAMISISPPCSLEQLILLITFIFPSLQDDKTKLCKEDFHAYLNHDEHIEAYFLGTTQQKMFILKEGSYPEVLKIVHKYFSSKNNMIQLRDSIICKDIINSLLQNPSL